MADSSPIGTWRKQVADALAERDALREELWQCYLACGGDPDGADACHLNSGEALQAVRTLRDEYNEAAGIPPLDWEQPDGS